MDEAPPAPPLSPPAAPADLLGDLLPEREVKMTIWLRAPVAVVGGASFVMGFVGWVLPGIPGLPFHIAGLFLIHISTPAGCRAVNWMDRRMPGGARKLLRVARRGKKAAPAGREPQGSSDAGEEAAPESSTP